MFVYLVTVNYEKSKSKIDEILVLADDNIFLHGKTCSFPKTTIIYRDIMNSKKVIASLSSLIIIHYLIKTIQIKGQSKYNESNILLLSSFQCFTVFISYDQNDNSSLLAERFQYFTGMIIPVKCWNHSTSKLLSSVCYSSELSQLFTALSSDE